MSRCAIRRGFFVLRDCGARPVGTCDACGRAACGEHATEAPGGGVRCVECDAVRPVDGDAPEHFDEMVADADAPRAAVFAYRRHFYKHFRYRPHFGGVGSDPTGYYDDFDLLAFELADDVDFAVADAAAEYFDS